MASDYNTNQNRRPRDENSGKNMTPNYGDDPATPRPNDPTRPLPLNSLPSEEIPTQNLDVDVPPSTNDLNNINTAGSGGGYPMSVKSFGKLRKNYGVDFWWPRVKKTKHADDDDEPSLPIHSLPSSSNSIPCNAVLNPTISALISALVPALTSALTSALLPLLPGSSNPIPLALTNPTSAQEFNCLKLKDKRSNADFLATELLNLDADVMKVHANYILTSGTCLLYSFHIGKTTTYDELVSILWKKLSPMPSRMLIRFEDHVGDFVILGDDEDMKLCLMQSGKLINLVIVDDE